MNIEYKSRECKPPSGARLEKKKEINMLQKMSLKRDGKDLYYLTYNNCLLRLEPTMDYASSPVEDILLFSTEVGSFFLTDPFELDAYYKRLAKKLPQGEPTIVE